MNDLAGLFESVVFNSVNQPQLVTHVADCGRPRENSAEFICVSAEMNSNSAEFVSDSAEFVRKVAQNSCAKKLQFSLENPNTFVISPLLFDLRRVGFHLRRVLKFISAETQMNSAELVDDRNKSSRTGASA